MIWENCDKISIRKLEVFGNHGIFPEENRLGQKFIVNATIYADLRESGMKDDFSKTIDYGKVAHFIARFMRENTFRILESVAEQMAEEILLRFPVAQGITLEIQKPWAPLGLSMDAVSVEITRGWHRAYLSVGSNLGDRAGYIENGVRMLSQARGCVVEQVSALLETKPYGVENQPDFLNGVVQLRTMLGPEELLAQLRRIEDGEGRERVAHWGPRTLDLDILFYDDMVIDSEKLQVPHPDMQNRKFVLEPLAQLAPWMRHPLSHKTVRQMLEEVSKPSADSGPSADKQA